MDRRHNALSGNSQGPLSDEDRRAQKAWTFLGAEIIPKEEKDNKAKITAIVPPTEENEGSTLISSGSGSGFFGQTMDVRGDSFASEQELIAKYRFAAQHPEVDAAIEDIVNEAIVGNDEDLPVKLNLNNLKTELASEKIKDKINDEFETIIRLLDFRRYGHDIFRRWYVDGRLAYHVMVDLNNVKKGIQELRPLSPMKIRKVKEVVEEQDPRTGAKIIGNVDEYFIYNEEGFAASGYQAGAAVGNTAGDMTGLRLTKEAVAYVTSGRTDGSARVAISYVHTALRNVNQLRMMEDSLVIYRLARAPERRIFYIDVGNLPKQKAEAYIEGIKNRYRNKMVYDVSTGDVKDGRRDQSILEDFWLPRREGGRGTEISTLPGGDNLGQIDDIVYFQKKLYRSLHVPINRLDNEAGFAIGRSTEISRDEVKFQKFIDRLRVRFSDLFKQLLRTQLIFKGIIKAKEWDLIKEYIIVDYNRDSHFAELAASEMLRERVATLDSVVQYEGIYFSKDHIRKVILGQTDDEIEEMKKQIRKEALNNDELPDPDEAGDAEGGGAGGDLGGAGGDLGGGDADFADLEDEGAPPPSGPAGAATALGPDDEFDDDEDVDDDDEEPETRT